jgi:hypothetical protein
MIKLKVKKVKKKFSHTESEGEGGTAEVGKEVVDDDDSEEGDDDEVVNISEETNENQRAVGESEISVSVKELEISEELTITTRLDENMMNLPLLGCLRQMKEFYLYVTMYVTIFHLNCFIS